MKTFEHPLKTYEEFWPFYLSEHLNPQNRRLHYIGTSLVLLLLLAAVLTQTWWLLWVVPFCGYGFAWVGHFIIEKNRPATFKYPGWSLISDFKMFYKMLTGKLEKDLQDLYESR